MMGHTLQLSIKDNWNLSSKEKMVNNGYDSTIQGHCTADIFWKFRRLDFRFDVQLRRSLVLEGEEGAHVALSADPWYEMCDFNEQWIHT